MRKIKRPMYFETDDHAELSDFYYGEIDKLNNYSSGMNTEYIEERLEKISKRQNHDEEVLDYRRMHLKDWEKYQNKLNPPTQEEKEEDPPPEQEHAHARGEKIVVFVVKISEKLFFKIKIFFAFFSSREKQLDVFLQLFFHCSDTSV